MSLPAADHRPLRALIVLSTYLLLCHALQSRLLIHQLRNRIEVIDDEYEFSLTRWDLISYAHEDEPLRDELAGHLKILERRGLIQAWHDRKIVAGQDWAAAIDENLSSAELVLGGLKSEVQHLGRR